MEDIIETTAETITETVAETVSDKYFLNTLTFNINLFGFHL